LKQSEIRAFAVKNLKKSKYACLVLDFDVIVSQIVTLQIMGSWQRRRLDRRPDPSRKLQKCHRSFGIRKEGVD
jgi:hypothetical protein